VAQKINKTITQGITQLLIEPENWSSIQTRCDQHLFRLFVKSQLL